jgi:ketopantoate reductase
MRHLATEETDDTSDPIRDASGDIRRYSRDACIRRNVLCQIVPAAALSALTRLPYYQVCKHPDLAALFVDLTHECAAVACADGVQIGDYQGFNPYTLVTLPRAEAIAALIARGGAMEAQGLTEMRISMLQDLLRGRPTEVEETLGYVVRRAGDTGVDVPHTRFAYRVIRGVESYL